MLQRAITGAIFIIVLIGSILFSPIAFSLLFFVITVLGSWEFYALSERTNHQPQRLMGISLGVVLFSAVVFNFSKSYYSFYIYPLALFLPLLFSVFIVELYRKGENSFGNIAFTLLGVVYVAVPFSLFLAIAFNQTGYYSPNIILGILFILWSSDTGAYLSGKAFGKHKLFERVSPKKTWEGTIGGGILAIIIAYIVSIYFVELNAVNWVIISLIIVVFGSLGDLVESLFKRTIDVKDSGTILPGHGGILDRFDGLILSVPFIFTYLFFIEKL